MRNIKDMLEKILEKKNIEALLEDKKYKEIEITENDIDSIIIKKEGFDFLSMYA